MSAAQGRHRKMGSEEGADEWFKRRSRAISWKPWKTRPARFAELRCCGPASSDHLGACGRGKCQFARQGSRPAQGCKRLAFLTERKSQQARAQQHQAGCGQCEESVRDQIVVAHDTPATLDARPNLLNLSESPASKEVMRLSARGQATGRARNSGPGTITFKRMGQENPHAHQAHYRCNRLNHRTNPLRPCTHRTTAPLHSQKDSAAETTDPGRVMICCNRLSESGTGQGCLGHSLRANVTMKPVNRRIHREIQRGHWS